MISPVVDEMLGLHPILSTLTIFLLSLDLHFHGIHGASKEDVERHLQMGKKLLAAGQLADALHHYHQAIEGDPKNYMSYFQRATVYLAIGKSKSALPDLDHVLELKPDFSTARQQRASILLKQGRLKEAAKDYADLVKHDPSNQEAQRQLDLIGPLQDDIEDAKEMVENNNHVGAIELLSKAIEHSPWDVDLRELRAECYINIGDYFKAIHDIKPTTKLISDNTGAYLKISQLYYQMGEAEDSLNEIRECLKLDQDHPKCFKHYKKVKKLVKQMQSTSTFIQEGQYDECISKVDAMLKTEPDVEVYRRKANGYYCHCHSAGGNFEKALKICSKIIENDENNIDALCDRAEAYLANDMLDDGMNDYQQAHNIDQNNRRAEEGLQKAQKLKKQAGKRDYYKILGVRRNANKQQIMKAYRKLAVKWHPDKYDGEDKKKAEKMFIDIASAKEVLTDPEKRQKFDQGEDPLDPEAQARGGDPFFHQGFNPFGGGGFQFKFHFN
ncbi:dnaJ homolog subfamily C member 3-like [Lineus longissimus]|uniref:dnaJ homolog subfamily C member 3-like n=1 Tax=Lineus longissimus TaxID=88925 RepID=UPI002B4E2748